MYGNNGINQHGQYPPHRPPSYASVQQEKAEESTAFLRNLAQAVDDANRTIAASPQPRELAKALVNHLIREHHLSLPQVSSAIQKPDNRLDPDQFDWDAWEKRHYTKNADGSYLEKEDFRLLQVAISRELSDQDVKDLKEKCTSTHVYGRGRVMNCRGYLDIIGFYNNQRKPVTPLMRECIQHGLFSLDFIRNVLFKDV